MDETKVSVVAYTASLFIGDRLFIWTPEDGWDPPLDDEALTELGLL